MRHAVTIGFVRDSKETVTVAPAHSPLTDQRIAFKQMRATRTHPRFERVELWTSDNGRVSTIRFNPPVAPPPGPEPGAKIKAK